MPHGARAPARRYRATRAPPPGGRAREQRDLGHPVARRKRPCIEADRRETRRERFDRFRANRLRAVQRDLQRGQIEPAELLALHGARAQVVREVRRDRNRGRVMRRGLQPSNGTPQERGRRHEHAVAADVQRMQQHADQPHVVKMRQPSRHDAIGVARHDTLNLRFVVQQITMRHDDAFGLSRRAGRVLQERDRRGIERRPAPRARIEGLERVGGLASQRADRGDRIAGRGQAVRERVRIGGRRRQRKRDARIADDPPGSLDAARVRGHGHRHGDRAGIQAAEKSRHKREAFGIDEQNRPARGAARRQPRGDRSRAGIQLRIAEPRLAGRITGFSV